MSSEPKVTAEGVLKEHVSGDVLKEHVERVFHQYEAHAKSFRSTLFWLLTFTAFFLFLVLFPYLSIQHELLVLPERLSRTEAEIKAREGRIEAFRRSHEGFGRLTNVIRSGPDELRAFLGSVSREVPMSERNAPFVQQTPVQQAPQAEPCAAVAGDERFSCLVLEHVRGQFDSYRNLLEAEVIGPLLAANGADAPLVDPSRLQEEIDRLEARFEARMAENPTFWRAYEEKGEFFVELEGDIGAFWQEYERLIAEQSEVLQREKAELVAAQAALLQDRADMEQLKGELKTRLDAIDTPFGKLPVGLNEAILGFPVLIAIGFLLCMRQLAETARLRRAFAALYRRRDPEGRLLTQQQIALIAPLWLDTDPSGRPPAGPGARSPARHLPDRHRGGRLQLARNRLLPHRRHAQSADLCRPLRAEPARLRRRRNGHAAGDARRTPGRPIGHDGRESDRRPGGVSADEVFQVERCAADDCSTPLHHVPGRWMRAARIPAWRPSAPRGVRMHLRARRLPGPGGAFRISKV
jgi:hypothetical protein